MCQRSRPKLQATPVSYSPLQVLPCYPLKSLPCRPEGGVSLSQSFSTSSGLWTWHVRIEHRTSDLRTIPHTSPTTRHTAHRTLHHARAQACSASRAPRPASRAPCCQDTSCPSTSRPVLRDPAPVRRRSHRPAGYGRAPEGPHPRPVGSGCGLRGGKAVGQRGFREGLVV